MGFCVLGKGEKKAQVPAYEVSLDVPEVLTAVKRVLRSGWLTQGPVVEQLEAAWAKLTEQWYGIAVSSGQSALEIALRAIAEDRGLRGGTVLMQANAFLGDPAAVIRAGFKPLFVDITDGLQIDLCDLGCRLASDIVGILVVHIGGWMTARMPHLADLCERRGWFLLEDACQAHGVRLDGAGQGTPAGSWGDAAVFSFYATKLVTCGEGGMIVTGSADIAELCRRFRCGGRLTVFDTESTHAAGDHRLSDILASIALAQTEELWDRIEGRAKYAAIYDEAVSEAEERWRPLRVPGIRSNWYKYIVELEGLSPTTISEKLRRLGVACAPAVGIGSEPAYRQPFVHRATYGLGRCSNAERICGRHIALPMFNGLGVDRASVVQKTIREVLKDAGQLNW